MKSKRSVVISQLDSDRAGSNGQPGPDRRVLGFQKFAQRDGALGVARERGNDLLGEKTEWLGDLLQVSGKMPEGEKLEDVLLGLRTRFGRLAHGLASFARKRASWATIVYQARKRR